MRVGFIGIGLMGRHMARHILDGGNDLTVYDIDKTAAAELLDKGANWASSPADAARNSEVVFTSLPRPQDVADVVLGEGGVLSGASEGTTFFDLSTTDPDTIQRISAAS